MDKLTHITGQIIPLPMNNVDTDLIIPAQYLTSTSMQGYADGLFRRLRDSNPQCPFNLDTFSKANILVSQDNFGCGSSREHAVWALTGWGIQVVIAESFADIFYNNCAKNGLILITQPDEVIQSLIKLSQETQYSVNIDIPKQQIQSDDHTYTFDMDPFNKHCFVNGQDHLDYLLAHTKEIKDWDSSRSPYKQYEAHP